MIEAREYEVRVAKPGHFSRNLTENLNGPVTRRVALETGSVKYTVRVRDDHFDPPRPVANATVEAGSVGSVRTLADGRASVGLPVNTVQQVRIAKSGYETVTRRIDVGEARENITVATRRTANVSLTASNRRVVTGESVTVAVRNAYDEPVARATVLRNGSAVGRTDAEGRLAVRIDDRGDHELRARSNGTTSDPVVVEGVVPEGADATTSAPATATADGSSGLVPGFGAGAAVAALALLTVAGRLARRRR